MDCIEIDLFSIVRDCIAHAHISAERVAGGDDNEWARVYFSTFNALIALEAACLSVPASMLREQLSHPLLRPSAELLVASQALMAQPKHDAHVNAWHSHIDRLADEIPL